MERLAGRSASELRKAAVNGDLAGGHEAAVRRREKGGHRCDLRRFGHALERVHRGEGLLAFLAERFLREFGRCRSGRQHVDPDAGALQVVRPGPREVAHCRLARAVGGECRGARGAGARSRQDDRPPSPISGSAFWTVKIEPFTLVSKISSRCSAVISPSGSWVPAPALAKTMSRVPRSAFTAA